MVSIAGIMLLLTLAWSHLQVDDKAEAAAAAAAAAATAAAAMALALVLAAGWLIRD